MCPAGQCATTTDAGVPIYFDTGHFTAAGSMWVARRWKKTGAFDTTLTDSTNARQPPE
jgi:hypothetical protein